METHHTKVEKKTPRPRAKQEATDQEIYRWDFISVVDPGSEFFLSRTWIRIFPRVSDLDPDPHSNCGSGSRKAKMTHKSIKSPEFSCF